MKLLIIAGPYEADRLRRATASAGFEAVAVGSGDGLSGWITATRPDVIIMAPEIVNGDPEVALAKVRAVPRGRVPTYLVGDVADESRLLALADGFFVRPLDLEEVVRRARAAADANGRVPARGGEEPGLGAQTAAVSGAHSAPVSAGEASGRVVSAVDGGTATSSPSGKTATLKPLAPARDQESASRTTEISRRAGASSSSSSRPWLLDVLAHSIDADFDTQMRDLVRAVGISRRAEKPPAASVPAMSAAPPPPSSLSSAGDDVEIDLPSLLARMYLARLSGRLTLTRRDSRKHIVFDRGRPVLAGSTNPDDRMGTMLSREGRWPAHVVAECAQEATATNRRLGAVLVGRGLLDVDELPALVRRHHEAIIYSLFGWRRGGWALGVDSTAGAETILLSRHPAAVILEGIRRTFDVERGLAAVGGAGRVLRLRLTDGASDLLDDMGLDTDERNLVLLFDGERALDEIRSLIAAPAERLYGVAWALMVLELLELVAAPSPDAAASPPDELSDASSVSREEDGGGAATEPAAPAAPEVTSNTPDDDDGEADLAVAQRQLIQSRYASLENGSYFQILGVPLDSSTQQIEGARDVALSHLAPEALVPSIAETYADELAELRAGIEEAARLLGDEHLRRAYSRHITGDAPAQPDAAGAPLHGQQP